MVVSFPASGEAWFPEVQAGMQQVGPETAEMMKQSPLYAAYAQVAPRVQDWPVLATKLGQLMRRPYDWTAEVAVMQVPTLMVAGDADSFSPLHAAEVFGLLGGGQKDPGWNEAACLPRAWPFCRARRITTFLVRRCCRLWSRRFWTNEHLRRP